MVQLDITLWSLVSALFTELTWLNICCSSGYAAPGQIKLSATFAVDLLIAMIQSSTTSAEVQSGNDDGEAEVDFSVQRYEQGEIELWSVRATAHYIEGCTNH